MKVNVTIGEWADTKSGEFNLNMKEGATVEDVMLILKLLPSETGLCAVNNNIVTRGHVLNEGDSLKFFPCIVGG